MIAGKGTRASDGHGASTVTTPTSARAAGVSHRSSDTEWPPVDGLLRPLQIAGRHPLVPPGGASLGEGPDAGALAFPVGTALDSPDAHRESFDGSAFALDQRQEAAHVVHCH